MALIETVAVAAGQTSRDIDIDKPLSGIAVEVFLGTGTAPQVWPYGFTAANMPTVAENLGGFLLSRVRATIALEVSGSKGSGIGGEGKGTAIIAEDESLYDLFRMNLNYEAGTMIGVPFPYSPPPGLAVEEGVKRAYGSGQIDLSPDDSNVSLEGGKLFRVKFRNNNNNPIFIRIYSINGTEDRDAFLSYESFGFPGSSSPDGSVTNVPKPIGRYTHLLFQYGFSATEAWNSLRLGKPGIVDAIIESLRQTAIDPSGGDVVVFPDIDHRNRVTDDVIMSDIAAFSAGNSRQFRDSELVEPLRRILLEVDSMTRAELLCRGTYKMIGRAINMTFDPEAISPI